MARWISIHSDARPAVASDHGSQGMSRRCDRCNAARQPWQIWRPWQSNPCMFLNPKACRETESLSLSLRQPLTLASQQRELRLASARRLSAVARSAKVDLDPTPSLASDSGRELRRDGAGDVMRSRRSLGEAGRTPLSPLVHKPLIQKTYLIHVAPPRVGNRASALLLGDAIEHEAGSIPPPSTCSAGRGPRRSRRRVRVGRANPASRSGRAGPWWRRVRSLFAKPRWMSGSRPGPRRSGNARLRRWDHRRGGEVFVTEDKRLAHEMPC